MELYDLRRHSVSIANLIETTWANAEICANGIIAELQVSQQGYQMSQRDGDDGRSQLGGVGGGGGASPYARSQASDIEKWQLGIIGGDGGSIRSTSTVRTTGGQQMWHKAASRTAGLVSFGVVPGLVRALDPNKQPYEQGTRRSQSTGKPEVVRHRRKTGEGYY